MRLSDVLSKPLSEEYVEVENFLGFKRLPKGKQRKIDVGRIGLPFFCKRCNGIQTFCSSDWLYCIGVNDRRISIDAALKCSRCEESTAEVWYLIVSNGDILSLVPKVRILKRSEKLADTVAYAEPDNTFDELFEKAHKAYFEGLGAGAIIYLRKIFEQITVQSASASGIELQTPKGKRKPFQALLQEVDKQKSIIPKEFSANGYKLYKELSEVIHGNSDEETSLKKYNSLRRLVVGILDNIRNNDEMTAALRELGWMHNEVMHE